MVTFLGIGIGIEGQFDVGIFVLDKELKFKRLVPEFSLISELILGRES